MTNMIVHILEKKKTARNVCQNGVTSQKRVVNHCREEHSGITTSLLFGHKSLRRKKVWMEMKLVLVVFVEFCGVISCWDYSDKKKIHRYRYCSFLLNVHISQHCLYFWRTIYFLPHCSHNFCPWCWTWSSNLHVHTLPWGLHLSDSLHFFCVMSAFALHVSISA